MLPLPLAEPGIIFGSGNDNFTNSGYASVASTSGIGIEMGAGDDNITNSGTLDSNNTIDVGAGNDSFINDGTVTVNSGAQQGIKLGEGYNTFENKTSGIININSTNDGITFGADDDSFTNDGSITITTTGTNAIAMGEGYDNFTTSGALNFDKPIDGGADTDIFTLNGTAIRSFDQDIVNFETINKEESGSWDLTGAITGATAININNGELHLNGTITAPISLASAGALGITSPNSIGTLNYAGNFTQSAGGLLIDVDNESADLFAITGNANITSGTLIVNPLASYLDYDWTQKILDATGIRTGEFASILSTSALFEFEGDYTVANEVWLNKINVPLLTAMENASTPITANNISQGNYIQQAIEAGERNSVN